MKIKGKTVLPPKPVVVLIPREDGNIEFTCGPVLDFSEFHQLCPEPKPPLVMKPGKGQYHDVDDAQYKAAMAVHAEHRQNWLILQSLNYTEDLEWDKIDAKDPDTWKLYREEMNQVFTEAEISAIIIGITDANVPTEEKQKEAMGNSQPPNGAADVSSSQKDAQDSTDSGEPVKD